VTFSLFFNYFIANQTGTIRR